MARTKKQGIEQISLMIPNFLKTRIEELASEMGMDRSAYICMALKMYVDNQSIINNKNGISEIYQNITDVLKETIEKMGKKIP